MKIICIGRNYVNHAKEMKAPVPSEPLFFMKPDTALFKDRHFYYPDFTQDLHHEIELVVKICKMGKYIAPEFAGNYYQEIGLGIDFTARDIQKECKENRQPWEKAKAFDHSAVISQQFLEKSSITEETPFQLYKNEHLVQSGCMKDMIFSVEELIVYVSKFITLKPGDLLYTGTPAGVGPVEKGDVLVGKIDQSTLFEFDIR